MFRLFIKYLFIIFSTCQNISNYSWNNIDMKYYIVNNKNTPIFNPEVSVYYLIERSKNEYELPGITLNLTFSGFLYTNKKQVFDGKNTISFSPNVNPGETSFYSIKQKRLEFDMRFNNNCFKTPETLFFVLLHEWGHVFGLNHPNTMDGSLMSKPLIKKHDIYIQEYKYYMLTKNDVIGLYKHEMLFRSTDLYKVKFLNNLLFNLLPFYPDNITSQ